MLDEKNKEMFKKITTLENKRRELNEQIDEIESQIETITWQIAKRFEEAGEVEELPTVSLIDEGLTASLKIENCFSVPKESKQEFISELESDPEFSGIIYKTWSFNKLNSHLNEVLRNDGKLPDSIQDKVNSFSKYKVNFRKMTDKQKENLKKKNIL